MFHRLLLFLITPHRFELGGSQLRLWRLVLILLRLLGGAPQFFLQRFEVFLAHLVLALRLLTVLRIKLCSRRFGLLLRLTVAVRLFAFTLFV